jgi:hypothetical protein
LLKPLFLSDFFLLLACLPRVPAFVSLTLATAATYPLLRLTSSEIFTPK